MAGVALCDIDVHFVAGVALTALGWLTLCRRIALVLGCLHLENMEKQLENANLKEAHMTIAEKLGKQNAS